MSGLKVLVIGGYGVFGGRLVRLLADEPGLALIVAGRSGAKAEAFCGRWAGRARLVPHVLDRDGDVGEALALLAPDIVVDASGPFQAYGAAPYRVVDAAIAAGSDYLDLADAAAFVQGVASRDAAARAAGVAVISGASSFPALTAAAIAHMSRDWAVVTRAAAGIAPSPFAEIGPNVIRAMALSAGQPVAGLAGSQPRFAFCEQRRVVVAPPGAEPLEPRLFALVDAPELVVLRALWPEIEEVWTGAGPRPELLFRALIGLAWLARAGLLPPLGGMATLMARALERLRWGAHRGGMFVAVEGRDATGAKVARSWHMIAEGDDGPFIPAMACAALIRARLRGVRAAHGARSAAGAVTLGDYDNEFAGRAICWGVREEAPAPEGPLYRRLLGAAWEALPAPIRAVHDVGAGLVAEGRARTEQGPSPPARLIAKLFGFAETAADAPARVRFTIEKGGERWTRALGGGRFSSWQGLGRGRSEGLLVERFGPFAFGLAVVVGDGRLRLVLKRWTAFGMALPLWLAPRAEAHERVEEGRFRFEVTIRLPLVGLIAAYRGWLVPLREGADLLAPERDAVIETT